MKMKNVFTIVVASVLSAVVAVALFKAFGGNKILYQNVAANDGFETASYQNRAISAPFDFTDAAEIGLPAVVHIRSTVERNATDQRQMPRSMEDFWDQFFGTPRGYEQGDLPPAMGFGSGVVISPDGYIVTNNHVIDNASEIKVTFFDSKIVDAELVGTDPTTDIALLKVKDTNLPYLKFADSDNVRIGEWVAAIGNPAVGGDAFTLKSTVTAGIVSAIGRNIGINTEELAIESFIQTDAVINRGNSGGALVNSEGNLVGINTAISTPTGVYAGYGFAVPANLVKKVVTDLKDFGEVKRALMGVQYQDIEYMKSIGGEPETSEKEGLLIKVVSAGSAADKAGLKVDDVLIKIDGIDVTDGKQNKLQEIIGRKRPGEVVEVEYIRGGNKRTTNVTLLSAEQTSENYETVKNVTRFDDLGLILEDLTKEELAELEIQGGVRVNDIDRNGVLFRRSYGDITVGFIITEINGIAVKDVATAKNALRQTEQGRIRIQGFNENDPSSRYTYTFPVQ